MSKKPSLEMPADWLAVPITPERVRAVQKQTRVSNVRGNTQSHSRGARDEREKLKQFHVAAGFHLATSIESLISDLKTYILHGTPATSFLSEKTASAGVESLELLIVILRKLVAEIKVTNFENDSTNRG